MRKILIIFFIILLAFYSQSQNDKSIRIKFDHFEINDFCVHTKLRIIFIIL
jgi:hypothetical protein